MRVEKRIADLERDFDAVVAASESANLDDEHDPEGSTIGFERAQVRALLNQARADLAELDAAGKRVAGGTYGVCARVCRTDRRSSAGRAPDHTAVRRLCRAWMTRASVVHFADLVGRRRRDLADDLGVRVVGTSGGPTTLRIP